MSIFFYRIDVQPIAIGDFDIICFIGMNKRVMVVIWCILALRPPVSAPLFALTSIVVLGFPVRASHFALTG